MFNFTSIQICQFTITIIIIIIIIIIITIKKNTKLTKFAARRFVLRGLQSHCTRNKYRLLSTELTFEQFRLECSRKQEQDGRDLIEGGRLFHTLEAATGNE